MLYKSKLKGSFGRVYPLTLMIVYILCVVEVVVRTNFRQGDEAADLIPFYSIIACGVFFIVAGILQSLRFGLWVYAWLGFHLGLGCFLALFVFPSGETLSISLYAINFLLVVLVLLLNWSILRRQERLESNARRIFKRAVNQIHEVSNGYTERPYSAGSYEADINDVLGLGRYLESKNIVRLSIQSGDVYLAYSLNQSVLKVNDPQEVSYAVFSKAGDLSVRIAKKDYKQYREAFSFDQLCMSMSQVFLRFLNHYESGNEHRILDELKSP